MTVVCEVGPGTVRRLTPVSATGAAHLVEAALGADAEPLTLFDGQPVPTGELWRRVFVSLLPDAGPVLLVHPSWWPASRLRMVVDAAESLGPTVRTCPRYRLLYGGAPFVEIGPALVMVGDDRGVSHAEARGADIDVLADAVAAAVAMPGEVILDAPAGVPGAVALRSIIALRLAARGRRVRTVTEHRLCTALPPEPETGDREAVAVRRRALPAAAATAALTAAALVAVGVGTARSGSPAAGLTTDLIEGRVAVAVPRDWDARRVTGGPGSARVEVTSRGDPGVKLHVTQSRSRHGGLEQVARDIGSALRVAPGGVFVDFVPDDVRAGRPAVTYREVRADREILWAVVPSGSTRIAIGCQRTPAQVCEQAVASAREIG